MSKYVCEENMCAGCMACVDICAAGAVSVVDSVKSYNAVIDEEKCIECGKCRKVCQYVSKPELTKPLSWCQGWSRDEAVRGTSSSGGFAAEIGKAFIEGGGVVYSCVFQEGRFIFKAARTVEDMAGFKGSKYVKSNPLGIYKEIKELLSDHVKVLFIGLPCQAASLRNYCEGPGLYIADIICHGTPSPKVLYSFLRSYGKDLNMVNNISFRVNNKFELRADERNYSIPKVRDYYMDGFLKGMTYTDNCYQCRYAQLSRVSDLTIGDAWGSELPGDIRKKGVSIALCQTEKGKELLDKSNLELMPIDLDKAVKANTQLDHPSEVHKDRMAILTGIADDKKYTTVIRKLHPKWYCKNKMKAILYHMGLFPKK